ncbi:alpha/beta hydrolase [Qipengyuania qiaonensis]|uniref:Alpha/beta hydrolase n=1 Tax=Qipengyuania qiaonensis TaxID=2867240 RepID=A0ABS7J9T3_9SPHN|nr:alpha/beta hydrolase [Qipengyuania qiaonensis]MBX7481737.1 alpha/beta hydrolase [Qipengyuania qiaonensis]
MSRPIRVGMWILVFFATAYLAVLAILWSQQERFIYPAPRAIGPTTGGFEEIAYRTDDGLLLNAGYRPSRAGSPTILYFHGNGADWVSSVVATDRLVPEGYGVLAAEYRGYRGNPGNPSEEGLYRDGRAAIDYLKQNGLAEQDIVIIGNSIGSGVAVQMAREIEPMALVLVSPFSSLAGLVAEKFRWLPTSLLLRDRYDNAAKLADIRSDILILHGDADSLIPYDHAQRLAAANPRAKVKIFRGAGHDLAWHDVAEEAVLNFLGERTYSEGTQ